MSDVFNMLTDETHTDGVKGRNLAEEFGVNRRKVNEIVERITASEYTSDDAIAIASEIRSFDPLLNEIQDRLENFGNIGVYASRETVGLNEQIKESVNNS